MDLKIYYSGNKKNLSRSYKSAGLDLFTEYDIEIKNEPVTVPLNLHMAIPDGYVGFIKSRSGLGFKYGIQVFGGVIDSDYRGKICVLISRIGNDHDKVLLKAGTKIAQIVIMKILNCDATFVNEENFEKKFANTERGDKGFGSSDSKN
jgi:dUTP pyrophosphatase